MGKKAEQQRIQQHGNNVALEQTAIYDDSLLPPAEELAKLQAIDSTCIEWIKSRTEREQDARIKYNFEHLELAKLSVKKSSRHIVLGMTLLFFVIIIGFGLSMFCLYKGYDLAGSIFGGADFVALIVALAKLKTPIQKL